jgi:hypothetical protein
MVTAYFNALPLNSLGEAEENQLPITLAKVFSNPSEFRILQLPSPAACTALLIQVFRAETPNVAT